MPDRRGSRRPQRAAPARAASRTAGSEGFVRHRCEPADRFSPCGGYWRPWGYQSWPRLAMLRPYRTAFEYLPVQGAVARIEDFVAAKQAKKQNEACEKDQAEIVLLDD